MTASPFMRRLSDLRGQQQPGLRQAGVGLPHRGASPSLQWLYYTESQSNSQTGVGALPAAHGRPPLPAQSPRSHLTARGDHPLRPRARRLGGDGGGERAPRTKMGRANRRAARVGAAARWRGALTPSPSRPRPRPRHPPPPPAPARPIPPPARPPRAPVYHQAMLMSADSQVHKVRAAARLRGASARHIAAGRAFQCRGNGASNPPPPPPRPPRAPPHPSRPTLQGDQARLSSFMGAIAIADLVKTTLGPKGMDKILQSVRREARARRPRRPPSRPPHRPPPPPFPAPGLQPVGRHCRDQRRRDDPALDRR